MDGILFFVFFWHTAASTVGSTLFPKQCGNTWGSYGNSKQPGWLDRGGGRGSVQNSSLFSWFRACMFVSSVNFHSFRGGRADARGFCLKIFVVSGSSTSSMFIFRGNSRTLR